jgi:hypothetical protein
MQTRPAKPPGRSVEQFNVTGNYKVSLQRTIELKYDLVSNMMFCLTFIPCNFHKVLSKKSQEAEDMDYFM